MKARIKDHLESAAGHIKTAAALAQMDGDNETAATLAEMAKGIDAIAWDLSGDGDDEVEESPDGPAPVFYRADLSKIDDLLSGPCWTA